MIEAIFFYCFAFLVLLGSVLTVTRKSAVHSAISLIVALIGVAGLFLLQRAEFLFATQIILYIGGVMVLFLYVIMLVIILLRFVGGIENGDDRYEFMYSVGTVLPVAMAVFTLTTALANTAFGGMF